MFGDVIVPFDGSELSARALPPAVQLARELDSTLDVIVVDDSGAPDTTAATMRNRLADHGIELDDRTTLTVRHTTLDPSTGLANWLTERPGDLVCMATHGRGRSSALLGSAATEVLRQRSGPVVLAGPGVDSARFSPSARMLVPVDGSDRSAEIMTVAAPWAIVFHNEVDVIQVLDPDSAAAVPAALRRGDTSESAYVSRTAKELSEATGCETNFDVLHHADPAAAIVRQADDYGSGIIAMSTHGATGLERIIHGSVTSEVIRRSQVPVLTLRPPSFG